VATLTEKELNILFEELRKSKLGRCFIVELKKIHQNFSVCQVEDYSLENIESEYCFIGKTDMEKSLVCITDEALQM